MQIEMIKTSELIPYEKNPRKNDAAVDKVAASIKEFGFLVPIVIDRNNEIAAGHTRLKAALQLGIERVPCVRANDLTDEQIKAFRLADNKTAEFAEWDFTELDKQLEELMNTEIDMTLFGFTFDVIPDDLDDIEHTEEKTAVRLVFDNYKSYSEHETEIKDFAEKVGAKMSIGK